MRWPSRTRAPSQRFTVGASLALLVGVLSSGCATPPSPPGPGGPGPAGGGETALAVPSPPPLTPIASSHGKDPKFTFTLLGAAGYAGGCGDGDAAFKGGSCHFLQLRVQTEDGEFRLIDINGVEANGTPVDWVCVAGHCGLLATGSGPHDFTQVFNTAGTEPLAKVREEETQAVLEIPRYAIGPYASGVRPAITGVEVRRGVNCYGNPAPDYNCHNITVELENKGARPVSTTEYNSWEILTGTTSYGPPFGGAPTQGPKQVAPGSKAAFSLLANLEDAENVAKVRFYDGAWMLQPAVASRT